jgi:hypothetical protein
MGTGNHTHDGRQVQLMQRVQTGRGSTMDKIEGKCTDCTKMVQRW